MRCFKVGCRAWIFKPFRRTVKVKLRNLRNLFLHGASSRHFGAGNR